MIKKLVTASTIVFLLAAFAPVSAQKAKQNSPSPDKTDVKFLDDIQVNVEGSMANAITLGKDATSTADIKISTAQYNALDNNIERLSHLQIKYGILLNTEVELIKNFSLYKVIDEWYGTPYLFGGTSKLGVDCSAFVRAVYNALFGILLPRTAHEQYQATRQIARNELKEGDLVFFNTMGGVSHVGIYLQNNKFVSAASSEGVSISDLDDSYWSRRFVGATRYDMAAASSTALSQPQP